MGTSNYNMADLGQARQAIGAQAGKFGSVGDGIPQNVSAGMFGTLPNSAAAAQAATALCSMLRAEYVKAEGLVTAIERTLDSNVNNTGQTETNNKQSFAGQQA
jgi:hypothetical protein